MKNQKALKLDDLKVSSFLTKDDMNAVNGGVLKTTTDPIICNGSGLDCRTTGGIPCDKCGPETDFECTGYNCETSALGC